MNRSAILFDHIEELYSITKQIEDALVYRNFRRVVELTNGMRYTEELLQTAIDDVSQFYSPPFIPRLTEEMFANEVYELAESIDESQSHVYYKVAFRLWNHEGPTDFSILLSFHFTNGISVSFDDLRVM